MSPVEYMIDEYFSFETYDGKIESKGVLKGRVFIFSAEAWSMINQEIKKKFGKRAEMMLFEMGLLYGGKIGSQIRHKAKDVGKSLKEALESAAAAGWGQITISGSLPTGTDLVVNIRNCVFCSAIDERKAASCAFLRGIVNGFSSTLYGIQFVTRETKCIANGDDVCQFSLTLDQLRSEEKSATTDSMV